MPGRDENQVPGLGSFCFNRRGEPISFMEASVLLGDVSARRVAETFLTDGTVRVSTVHLPFDLSAGIGPPRIFETMVFVDGESCTCAHFSTEEEALDGHNALVEAMRVRPDLLERVIINARSQRSEDE